MSLDLVWQHMHTSQFTGAAASAAVLQGISGEAEVMDKGWRVRSKGHKQGGKQQLVMLSS